MLALKKSCFSEQSQKISLEQPQSFSELYYNKNHYKKKQKTVLCSAFFFLI